MKKIISLICLLLCAALIAGCASAPAAAPTPEAKTAPAETAAEPAPEPAAPDLPDGAVLVSTVDELVRNIKSDTTIYLEAGLYDLSSVKNYGETMYGALTWQRTYDGFELIIKGVSNLRIIGDTAETTVISAKSRYANVINFVSCSDVALENITAGHTEEPGSCSGGVIRLENCLDVLIDGCELYGCGILGVMAYDSERVSVRGTDIYDCSDGATLISACRDVCFDGCRIFDCSSFGSSLFTVNSSSEVAVINSEIYSNTDNSYFSDALISADYSSGVYFGGNTVKGNQFAALVYSSAYPITVDRCTIEDVVVLLGVNKFTPIENVGAVDRDGNVLTTEDILAMECSAVTWSAAEQTAPVAEPSEADGIYRVGSVDEFLAAIGPDRVIELADGVYDFSTAQGYGSIIGEYYNWENNFDGPGIMIHDVDNMSITASAPENVTIAAVPRYADVLNFRKCSGITLSGFTAGHTEEPGYCTGGVLKFSYCDNISVDNCSLYGCGTYGVEAGFCDTIAVSNTEIYHCTYGGVNMGETDHISFVSCNFHDLVDPHLGFYNCRFIDFDGAALYDGSYNVVDGVPRLLERSEYGDYDYAQDMDSTFTVDTVHLMTLDGEWEKLANLCHFPLELGSLERAGGRIDPSRDRLIDTREDFLALDLDTLFDADFCDNSMERIRANDSNCGIYLGEEVKDGKAVLRITRLDPWIFSS